MRKKELAVGDKVFDLGVGYWGHITAIEGNTIRLFMDDDDLQKNLTYFAPYGIDKEEYGWEVSEDEEINQLYQIAPGLYGRDENPVCYEHNNDFPYFSPYLEVSLLAFEVYSKDEFGFTPKKIVEMIKNGEYPTIAVEDENGELRPITFAWFDKELNIVRLTIGHTEFKDAEEE